MFNFGQLIDRVARKLQNWRRLRRLKGSAASGLKLGHIESLELLDLCRDCSPIVIYDIGANVGTWTLLAKAIFPNSQIEAFEPLKNHLDEFEKMTKTLTNVHVHEIALGSIRATQTMHVASASDASSLLEIGLGTEREYNIKKCEERQVKVFPLDEYVLERNLPYPDIMKLDIQGYELEAIRGAERCLKHTRYIILEVSFVELYNGQCWFHELLFFLGQRGFNVRAFGRGTQLGKQLIQADVLFGRIQ